MTKNVTTVKVKGTSYKQNFLQFARKCEKFWCLVRRQPKNEADKNAIIVWAVCQKKKGTKPIVVPVGYLPKELAAELAPEMDNGAKLYCENPVIRGGSNGYNCGLTIDIAMYTKAN